MNYRRLEIVNEWKSFLLKEKIWTWNFDDLLSFVDDDDDDSQIINVIIKF